MALAVHPNGLPAYNKFLIYKRIGAARDDPVARVLFWLDTRVHF